ncbi:MAG: protein kinase [Victivallaceae bacterium]|nr:protein kinase [Victivallaceae bacterium]
MDENNDAPLILPPGDIARPDSVFRNSCRACGQRFDVEGVAPFTRFACPHCGAPLVVPKIFGDYWLLKRLCDSGSARLYGALDPLLDREILMKIVKVDRDDPEKSATWRRRLYYDSQIQAQLDHPGAVEIYRTCRLENRDFKVCELLRGGPLRTADDPDQRTDTLLLLSALSETASLLAVAATYNVAHGAISPAHLLFNDDGALKLLNFRPPEEAGLPVPPEEYAFLSPERLLDFEMTPAGDVYSLGVLLYQMLTNRHPMGEIHGLSELELVTRQRRNPVPRLKGQCDFSDEALFGLIEAMLAPRSADRPDQSTVAAGLAAAAKRLARKRNLQAAVSRLSRKLQEKLVALQTGEFIAPDDDEEPDAAPEHPFGTAEKH